MAVRPRATRTAALLLIARLVRESSERGGQPVGRGLAGLRRRRYVDERRDLGLREARLRGTGV
jgi:hypothetical protein